MSDSQAESVSDLDRNLGLLAYALLFFAIFLGGLPALIAVAIAYARRHSAPPWIASHHNFQIWVFWIGLGLGLLMAGSRSGVPPVLLRCLGGRLLCHVRLDRPVARGHIGLWLRAACIGPCHGPKRDRP